MSLRIKLLILFSLTALAGVSAMDWGVERYARRQFQTQDQQRTGTLVAQFQQELRQRGQEVIDGVQGIADAESTTRMVLDLNRPQADASIYRNDAHALAAMHDLDFLELAGDDGTLISVAQWPEQVGYKNDWVTRQADWNKQGAFLDRVELADGVELGLLAVRIVDVGEHKFYIVGGRRIDRTFLQELALPAGMRALLYRNLEDGFVPAALSSANGPVQQAERLGPFIDAMQKGSTGSATRASSSTQETVQWTSDPGTTEKFNAVPLNGRQGDLLGVLLLGSSQGDLIALVNYVRGLALLAAGGTLLLGFVMSWWVAERVSRPLARLAQGIDDVAGGDWETQVEDRAGGEVARLLCSFNRMTQRLVAERHRILTTERVTAWRELAQQLVNEVQSGIAPLQRAVESLGRAHEQTPEHFEDVLLDSVAALRLELRILQAAVEGLAEFANPLELHCESVQLNHIVRAAVKSFEPQFCTIGRPPITPELYLDENVASVHADSARLQKAIENLLYRALVDMPAGGVLTIRTKQMDSMVHLVIADTGRGFEPVSPERIFSRRPAASGGRPTEEDELAGEGMLLATVQATVSDHRGKITVESAPGAGTTFYIDLPTGPNPAEAAKHKAAPPKSKTEAEARPAATPQEPANPAIESIPEPAPTMESEALLPIPAEATATPLTAPPLELAPDAAKEIEFETNSSVQAEASGEAEILVEAAAETAAEPQLVSEVTLAGDAMVVAVGKVEDSCEQSSNMAAVVQEPAATTLEDSAPALSPDTSIETEVPAIPQLSSLEVTDTPGELQFSESELHMPASENVHEKVEESAVEVPQDIAEPVGVKAEAWRSPLTYRG